MNEDKKIIIEQIDVEKVHYYKKDKFNSNNHWKCGKPDNYEEVLEKTETKYWINNFHKYYIVINIDSYDLKWMKEAINLSTTSTLKLD